MNFIFLNYGVFHMNSGKDSCVELPIQFTASEPGHYPCQIELCAPDDVRVYKVECTVNPEGSTAELDFKAPVHQSVTQEIPIVSFIAGCGMESINFYWFFCGYSFILMIMIIFYKLKNFEALSS